MTKQGKVLQIVGPKNTFPEDYLDSEEDSPSQDKIIEDIKFDEEDIKKAVMNTRSVASGTGV